MNYIQAMEYMHEVGKRGSILGLIPVKNLLNRLGNPQNSLSVIHVAGTNGKGSICTFLDAMYRANGKRVGRYISPTLHTYLERFQINGQCMSEDMFAKLLTKVKQVIEQMAQEGLEVPTAFEIETVIAFLYFVEEAVDVVVLETGMGGLEDATNVVQQPRATVFSAIGKDHMQFLGDTIEQIAIQKAGIMRENCPAVEYPNSPKVQQVLKKQADMLGTTIETVDQKEIEILSESLEGSTFRYRGDVYSISLVGTHQIYNAATAILCKLLVDGVVEEAARNALSNVFWEGRFEVVSKNPLLIKDGAHNIDGAQALYESLQKHFTNKSIVFIIGVLKDKEYGKMMRLLCPMADAIYTITPDNPRGLSAEVLRDEITQYCKQVTACDTVEDALDRAKRSYETYRNANKSAVIVAWGSLSYIGQITIA